MILSTGASRGIGKFLFDEFTKAGEEVFGTYFSVNADLEKNDKFFSLDVTDYKKADEVVKI